MQSPGEIQQERMIGDEMLTSMRKREALNVFVFISKT